MKCQCDENCIKNSDELLKTIDEKYTPCEECSMKTFKKAMPLRKQIKLEKLTSQYERCPACNRRHLDVIMAHVLKIMIENEQITKTASIRKAAMPLITPAIELTHPPYLPERSLVIITPKIDLKTSQQIYEQVPEIKAVIKGDTNQTLGIKDENTQKHNYQLMSGCPIRCDIQKTDKGYIPIYKDQSKLHIEYAKANNEKIEQISQILSNYENPKIIDAMCGPGTLGIYALKNNAQKVLFNDINSDSTNTTQINLKINNITDNYEIMNENILDLPNLVDEKYDIGFIDAFPGIGVDKYVDCLKKICNEVIII
ncbi:50S ribosomal protein L11 methyltransferase [Methanosphaera cuniculi]|uniref:50S ribosomal protein L11 methyltransferase n=1 Tax=Methanosphaera cuniculi TaxID=1077256 RepID=UPI0026F361D3|nr:50S ribosomal protein L11 methyltransferase [Methanosphaera cuniculi]